MHYQSLAFERLQVYSALCIAGNAHAAMMCLGAHTESQEKNHNSDKLLVCSFSTLTDELSGALPSVRCSGG